MLGAVVPAAFQYVEEAQQIGFRVGMRVGERIAHAGLRRHVDDVARLERGEQAGGRLAVGEVEAAEVEAGKPCQLGEAGFLEGRVVIVVDAVDADDGDALLEQPAGDVKADEARCAGHEYGCRVGKSHILNPPNPLSGCAVPEAPPLADFSNFRCAMQY